jgi:hypothetical protein
MGCHVVPSPLRHPSLTKRAERRKTRSVFWQFADLVPPYEIMNFLRNFLGVVGKDGQNSGDGFFLVVT